MSIHTNIILWTLIAQEWTASVVIIIDGFTWSCWLLMPVCYCVFRCVCRMLTWWMRRLTNLWWSSWIIFGLKQPDTWMTFCPRLRVISPRNRWNVYRSSFNRMIIIHSQCLKKMSAVKLLCIKYRLICKTFLLVYSAVNLQLSHY